MGKSREKETSSFRAAGAMREAARLWQREARCGTGRGERGAGGGRGEQLGGARRAGSGGGGRAGNREKAVPCARGYSRGRAKPSGSRFAWLEPKGDEKERLEPARPAG